MNKNYLFTSESVSPGHPDKLCDQLSDSILDSVLKDDKDCKVACEVLAKGKAGEPGSVILAGEITTKNSLQVEEKVRQVICDIGYDRNELGFNGNECEIITIINQQSPDIKMGVERNKKDNQGAGDQGLMFGYASNETEQLMPAPIYYSHRLVEKQTKLLKSKKVDWLLPDAKSQITFVYENGRPEKIDTVVLSTQHSKDVTLSDVKDFVMEEIIKTTIPKNLLSSTTKIHINPTGNFVIGGPNGDCGLTGRKIKLILTVVWQDMGEVLSLVKIHLKLIDLQLTWQGISQKIL